MANEIPSYHATYNTLRRPTNAVYSTIFQLHKYHNRTLAIISYDLPAYKHVSAVDNTN